MTTVGGPDEQETSGPGHLGWGGAGAPAPASAPSRHPMVDSGRRADRTFVEIGSTHLTIHHRLLKQPVPVALTDVVCVVRQHAVERPDLVLARVPRIVKLSAKGLDANVVLVVRRPVEVGPFRSGAEQKIPITAKIRRKGTSVELLALTLEDPDRFVERLHAGGVRVGAALVEELAATFGVATPEVAAARKADAQRAAWKVRAKLLVWVLAALVLYSARLALPEGGDFDWINFALLFLVATLIVLLAGIAAFLVPVRPVGRSRPVADRPGPWTKWGGLIGLAAAGLVLGAAIFARRTLDVPGYLAFGPVIALPACAMVVPMVRAYRRGQLEEERSAAPAPSPGPEGSQGPGLPPSPYHR